MVAMLRLSNLKQQILLILATRRRCRMFGSGVSILFADLKEIDSVKGLSALLLLRHQGPVGPVDTSQCHSWEESLSHFGISL